MYKLSFVADTGFFHNTGLMIFYGIGTDAKFLSNIFCGKKGLLRESANPFATVVLAHLHTQETAGDGAGRRREKMALIRHMYQKNFSRQDIINLFRFMDRIMHLPEAGEKLFWEELADFEAERKMPYITSVERIGYNTKSQAKYHIRPDVRFFFSKA